MSINALASPCTACAAPKAYAARAYQAEAKAFSLSGKMGDTSFSISGYSFSASATGYSVGTGSDSVDISPEAVAKVRTKYATDVFAILFRRTESVSGTGARPSAGADAFKTLDEVGADFQADWDRMSSLLGGVFSQAGFTLDPPLAMKLNGKGGIDTTAAGGQNAETAAAGAYFKKNSQVVSQFAVMAARGAIVEAGKSVDGFKESYAEDPAGTIKDYIGELEKLLFGFTMTAGADGMSYSFGE